MLNVSSEGIVSLPDGRTVCTVAAAQFRCAYEWLPSAYVLVKPSPSNVDEAAHGYLQAIEAATAEYLLSKGETVVMWGIAEGRLLPDGAQVATKAAYWQVCAL